MTARGLLSSVSFLNLVRWVAPGGFCHLRNGRDVVGDFGFGALWQSGGGRAEVQVSITDELRSDVVWWPKAMESRP